MTDQILNSERKYGLAEITSLANDGNDTGKAGAGLDISFSSSTPNLVDFRSQGLDLVAYEILDHSSQSCLDTTRSQYGLPILFNHNRDIQVGIGENVRIQDGKGRAGIRFGNSVKAQEVSKDVADEIATGVSVNAQYSFKNCTVIPAKEGESFPTIVVHKWMPVEVSIVPVAADVTVGTNRSLSETIVNEAVATVEAVKEEIKAEETAIQVDGTSIVKEIIEKVEEITELPVGTTIKNLETPTVTLEKDNRQMERNDTLNIINVARSLGLEKEANEMLSSDNSFDQIKGQLLELAASRHQPLKPLIDGDVKEMKQYDTSRAFKALLDNDNCVELEISREYAKKAGKDSAGFYIPTNATIVANRAGLDSKTTNAGTELKFTQAGTFIDLLRNRALVLSMGATVYSGLQGNILMPRQKGAGSSVWLSAENPGADIADSALQLDSVLLSPKTLMSTTSFSRQLLQQSSFDVSALVNSDLLKVTALALDLAAINGTGAAGQPLGILNTGTITTVAMTGDTNGLVIPGLSPLVDLESAVATANADLGSLAYLTTPGQRGVMKKTQKWTGSVGSAIWQDGEVNGYAAFASTQVPNTLTKGSNSNLSAVIFGNWNDLMFGEWGAVEVITDQLRLKKQGMIEVTSFYLADIEIKHGPSFAAIKSAI